MIDPFEIDFPTQFETERLLIRVPVIDDSAEINTAVQESLPELKRWMIWAQAPMSLDDTRANLQDSIHVVLHWPTLDVARLSDVILDDRFLGYRHSFQT